MEAFFRSPDGEALIERALRHLKTDTPPSIAALDRRLVLGYSMAARILTELEARGVVSPVQADGARRFIGQGQEARRAFEALAAEINAGIEPAARWWRRLSPAKRRAYLPGIADAAQWADLSAADIARARSIYWRNKDKFAALCAEFGVRGVMA